MKLKSSVRLKELQPQIVLAAMIVQSVFKEASCTITSANESKHSVNSLHYVGCALDFRTKDYKGDKAALVSEIKKSLGVEFDVVLESVGTPNEHCHIEWDHKEQS